MSLIKAKYYPYGSRIRGTKISRNAPIENLPEPKTVYVSVSQHIGAPALPVVNVGDSVKKGQLVAVKGQYLVKGSFVTIEITAVATFTVVHEVFLLAASHTLYTIEHGKILQKFLPDG